MHLPSNTHLLKSDTSGLSSVLTIWSTLPFYPFSKRRNPKLLDSHPLPIFEALVRKKKMVIWDVCVSSKAKKKTQEVVIQTSRAEQVNVFVH